MKWLKNPSLVLMACMAAASSSAYAAPMIFAAQQSQLKPACPPSGNRDGTGFSWFNLQGPHGLREWIQVCFSQCSNINSEDVPHCRVNDGGQPLFVVVEEDNSSDAPQFIQVGEPGFQVITTAAPQFVVEQEPTFEVVNSPTQTSTDSPSETHSSEHDESQSTAQPEPSAEPSPEPEPEPSPIPPPPPPPPTNVPLEPGQVSECEKTVHMGITSIYETSNPNLNYGACANINDGRGYSFGCVQFTTATSGLAVIRAYQNMVGGPTPMDRYLPGLQNSNGKVQWSGWGVTDGLDGFCDTVRSLAGDYHFQRAQRKVSDEQYLYPAYDLAYKHGVTTPLFRGQIYDTCIQLGCGTAQSILESMTVDRNNEYASLEAFINAREWRLAGFGPAFPGTVYRLNSYRYALRNGHLRFTDHVRVLDNGGHSTFDVTC
ncbi:lysozyme-like domain-containing protein [Chytridium lagenaria]|nr:lysozyme-like domain-containing protein [Chytridium lagenaria]